MINIGRISGLLQEGKDKLPPMLTCFMEKKEKNKKTPTALENKNVQAIKELHLST